MAAAGIMVDLRSDTVTRPTEAMRQVMKEAEVGDDVLGDDQTVIALQELAAKMLGKEAALFVPSGTMSNAIAIRAHTSPGDEIITEAESHIYVYEGGGFAALSGCSVALVPGENGIMATENVKKAIRKSAGSLGHYPDGTLVCVENTSNRGGGTCYPVQRLDEIAEVSHENDCAAHMDGARLFNAAIATDTSPDRLVKEYDSVSICLSKGLGAPVGSLLVGDEDFISKAYRWRKMFGGGMRQSGLVAAAGIHALENHIGRLQDDHVRIKKLAQSLNSLSSFSVNMDTVQSNMIYVDIDKNKFTADQVVQELALRDVHLFDTGPQRIRAVAHLDVDDAGIEQAIKAFAEID